MATNLDRVGGLSNSNLQAGGVGGGGGAGLSLVYAGNQANTTLAANGIAGDTTITVAGATGIDAGTSLGVSIAAAHVEPYEIESVDTANDRIEIASPGLFGGVGDTTLPEAVVLGATSFGVAHPAGFFAGLDLQIGTEIARISRVHGATITVSAGLAGGHSSGVSVKSVWRSGATVYACPMVGNDSVFVLPGSGYSSLEVVALYDLPLLNGSPAFFSGYSEGGSIDGIGWVKTHANYGSWKSFVDAETAISTSVGVIHTGNSNVDAWSLEYTPATNSFSLLPLDPNLAISYIPRVFSLLVRGAA